MARVLVTRAIDQARETADRLTALGHEPLLAPLAAVVPVPCRIDGPPPSCLAVTSRNAFAALDIPESWRHARLVAVGEATAEAARASGFLNVEAAEGDALALARRILKPPLPEGPVVYLAGRPRKPDFESMMAEAGIPLSVIETYRTDDIDALPVAASKAFENNDIDVVLHYSAGNAQRFAKAMAGAGFARQAVTIRHLVLSEDIAAVLLAAGIPADRIGVAGKPDQASLFAMLVGGEA